MYLQSGGTLVRKGLDITGTWSSDRLGGSLLDAPRWGDYAEIYRVQLWVTVLVNKLAKAQARLPLPVYGRDAEGGRDQLRDHPYARLLRNPSSRHDPFAFYTWTTSTLEIFGSMAWGKIRDAGGRPIELVLLHPAGLTRREIDGEIFWTFRNARVQIERIPDQDIVFFHTYNPDDPSRGLSPLEPLRATLENEAAARSATSSFWTNGARPGVALSHPGQLSQPAMDRLKLQWQNVAGGAGRTGSTVVLEEGMKPEILTNTAEEAQYIETRKLNREEVCAAYDVPPPVVHILDHATFSNITEQMRSMYRDTMAPRLGAFESVLESGLRGSVRPGGSGPDFGDDIYAEYLLDEVLRGDFEVRAAAIQGMVSSGQMTPNEARRIENRPPLIGGDQLFINSAMIPLTAPIVEEDAPKSDRAVDVAISLITTAPSLAQLPGLPVLVDQLRAVLEGKPLPVVAPLAAQGAPKAVLAASVVRKVMGRLARGTPAEVDVESLIEDAGAHAPQIVIALGCSLALGEDMSSLRARVAAIATKESTG